MTATDSDPHPSKTPRIVLQRHNNVIPNASGHGTRASIIVGGQTIHAIERADGFVRLPAGVHRAHFGWWYRRGGREKAIRVEYVTKEGIEPPLCWGILFHPANSPDELQGCIAPGLRMTPTGLAESRMGLCQLFAALGGWVEGRAIEIEVKDPPKLVRKGLRSNNG